LLKVASVIASLAARTGGPAHNLVESVRHLRDAGVDVTIFTTDLGAPASARSTPAGSADFPASAEECDIRVFEARTPRRLAYSPALWRALASDVRRFDVVRVHGVYLHPNLAAATVARRAGIPYLVTPHGAFDPWLRGHGRIRKGVTNALWQNRMLSLASAVHATTEVESNALAGVVPDHVRRYVVGNGVSVSTFQTLPTRGGFRAQLDLDAEVPMLLFMGRISRKKGIDVLIRAISRLQSRGAVLAVVGPDDERLTPRLKTLAREVGVSNRVFFVGPRFGPQRLAALADADVSVLASHAENFGNAVVEAMAAGVPTVVSTEVNLAPEIRAADAGLISACSDAEIARSCAEILDSGVRRNGLIEAGHMFARRYDWPRIADQLAIMFTEVSRK
jgi:glycosyltransferase involved in cell wall biosynthesis